MAADAGFGYEFDFDFDQGVNLPGGGSFSRLLLSDDVVSPFSFPVSPPPSSCTSLFSLDTPKMLCFGDFCEGDDFGSSQITSHSVSSSPVSKSSSNASINSLPNGSNCNKKRNDTPPPEKEASGKLSVAGTSKKIRSGHAKAKKREKLGDRIATLQQLVSPYGKTDTASVLHETMGYIRFLQDQVKVLCSPYLKRLPSPSLPTTVTSHGENCEYNKSTQGLKSKGLCLVPVGGIADMANGNGADLWSPLTSKTVAIANAATSTNATATASSMC
ncbi:hypothetical protein V2J09_018391 [Rumex salicifolius]